VKIKVTRDTVIEPSKYILEGWWSLISEIYFYGHWKRNQISAVIFIGT
jgi:hypothetical protein